jgi:hypothetical protein
VAGVNRVNLVDYFELAEALNTCKRATVVSDSNGMGIYMGSWALPDKLLRFAGEDNGFSSCKRVAKELASYIEEWHKNNLMDGGSPPTLSSEKLDAKYPTWTYGEIGRKIDAFKSVFNAECADVDVYSVGQIAIYKTSALVSDGAGIIPADIQPDMPVETLIEFNSAGKCLAFDLPTACGFHALRGLELVMDDYLSSFGVNTAKMKSWSDYIKAATKLIEQPNADKKPSAKVAAMLDRMRELERNPLMHPRDTLDSIQANMLFQLCAITVVEIARDMKANKAAENIPANDMSLANLFLPEKAAS